MERDTGEARPWSYCTELVIVSIKRNQIGEKILGLPRDPLLK